MAGTRRRFFAPGTMLGKEWVGSSLEWESRVQDTRVKDINL